MELLYYSPLVAASPDNFGSAGMQKFATFYRVFQSSVVVIDRTGTIKTPIRTKSVFPIPTLRTMTSTFEDLCNERARFLLRHAEGIGAPLYVLYSGGIDSTLVLVSLLKNATPEQKKTIVVLLSNSSIVENQNFYRDHIHGKLQVQSSGMFWHLLGTAPVIVGGEHNDQLFGSDRLGDLIRMFGPSVIHAPYSRDTFFSYLNVSLSDAALANFWLDTFERLKEASPVPIVTNADFLWWINFSLKWQSVFFRTLSYVSERHVHEISEDYIKTRYFQFYGTDDFQLWSLTNPDKKIKDTWNTYKWPCKDIIYDYNKDAEYRDTKTKHGSLFALMKQRDSYNFITDELRMYRELNPALYHEPENDFT